MTRVACGYVRLSQTSETSIDNQIADIEEYCNGHGDLVLEHIYNEGQRASGWDDSREVYRTMLADAEAGEFDALVVAHGSRLGRDKLERLDVFTDLANKWDVEFHTYHRGRVDPNLPEDILMEVFHSLSDDEGKGAEVDRLTRAIKKKVANGDYHGEAPMGTQYTSDKRALEADNDFDRVREILDEKDRKEPPTHRALAAKYDVSPALVTKLLKRRHIYDTIAASGTWRPSDTDSGAQVADD